MFLFEVESPRCTAVLVLIKARFFRSLSTWSTDGAFVNLGISHGAL